MARIQLTSITRLLATTVGLLCLCSLPVSGQQAVGAGFFGGPPPCTVGSNPALFDHNHDGPTADDLPAYLEILPVEGSPTANLLQAHFPNDGCFGAGSREIFVYEATSGNPWPGPTNSAGGVVGGTFEANVGDDNNDMIGGTYFQGGSIYSLNMIPSPTGSGAYEGVQATGGALNLTGGIQGWDLDPQDGVPDYIGLSWAGLTVFENCPDFPDLDDTMMLWVPVVPYAAAGGPPGAVAIRFDLDCDGAADGGYPPAPPVIPETTVPVALQSFSIASVLPSSPGGYALAFLFCALPIGALGLARRWLTGIDI